MYHKYNSNSKSDQSLICLICNLQDIYTVVPQDPKSKDRSAKY